MARVPARAIEKFCGSDVTVDGDDLVLQVGSVSYRLERSEAAALHDALGDALTRHREFIHTSGRHRADGSYVVSRRGAESDGHRKVFDSFGALEAVYDGLPASFEAEDVEAPGVTGGRRHLVVRHLVEHPAFDCELVSRQPLTAHKRGDP